MLQFTTVLDDLDSMFLSFLGLDILEDPKITRYGEVALRQQMPTANSPGMVFHPLKHYWERDSLELTKNKGI